MHAFSADAAGLILSVERLAAGASYLNPFYRAESRRRNSNFNP
jgi:hypothetical protein